MSVLLEAIGVVLIAVFIACLLDALTQLISRGIRHDR